MKIEPAEHKDKKNVVLLVGSAAIQTILLREPLTCKGSRKKVPPLVVRPLRGEGGGGKGLKE